jgi:hypothetical protein
MRCLVKKFSLLLVLAGCGPLPTQWEPQYEKLAFNQCLAINASNSDEAKAYCLCAVVNLEKVYPYYHQFVTARNEPKALDYAVLNGIAKGCRKAKP